MQPLHNSSPRGSKIMLKRMSRVRSDDKDTEEAKDELHDKTPSPIGAGLPLLQRLRLLKEKQVSWTPSSSLPTRATTSSHTTTLLCFSHTYFQLKFAIAINISIAIRMFRISPH